MASALRKFETNANLGIHYLMDKGVLTHDPLLIANFFKIKSQFYGLDAQGIVTNGKLHFFFFFFFFL